VGRSATPARIRATAGRVGGRPQWKLRDNHFNDAVDILDYVLIPKSKHTISFCIEKSISRGVARLVTILAMLPTIEFDNKPRTMFHEIQDVGTERRLASKMIPVRIQLTQTPP
jgi:hypothetical protein